MQKHEFNTGGYVVHKVYLPGLKSKFSVWIDASNRVTDAVAIDRRGHSRGVSAVTLVRLAGKLGATAQIKGAQS